ncbi:MAG: IS630 family transposase [wastewater metagenome]|nr:IS630 family transposase [Candidatus Loosdrechtia aerotolerans]
MKYVSPLNKEEIQTLQELYQRHHSRWVRMRAHSILLSHQKFPINEIAKIYQVDRRSVSSWIDRWQSLGLVGLYNLPRSGRPRILTPAEQQKALKYLKEYPRDLKKVAAVLQQKTDKRVSTKTIRRIAKRARLVWKRIKKSPAKQPHPYRYHQRQQMIEKLQQREKAGEIDLRYFDATGFSLEPCVPYAWQGVGETLRIPSSRSSRLNVLGFLNRQNRLYPFVIEGKVDTSVVIMCFNQFIEHIQKKTFVLLDNAPVHTSREFIRHIPFWAKKNLIIKYLPPYCPELNLIENLWRLMKYKWLPFSAYTSFRRLVRSVEHILKFFGSQYNISFQTP